MIEIQGCFKSNNGFLYLNIGGYLYDVFEYLFIGLFILMPYKI